MKKNRADLDHPWIMLPVPIVILTALLSSVFSDGILAENNQIVFTFNDLPVVGPLGFWRPREISNLILRTFEKHGIKAAGFIVEEKIDDNPTTYVVLQDWAERGHVLGNQTYSDVNLNELKAEDFLHHVTDGQTYLRRITRSHALKYRYFRYPFLHQGNTKRKKNRVAKALYRIGYDVAHVTVKTSDYRFNPIYIEHEQDREKISQLKSIYLDHIAQALDYAESQSQKVFKRNIKHILWLHCGVATAHFLTDLIEMLEQRGYKFITLPEALSDEAFQAEEEYVGPEALSFIDRVAGSRGLSFDPRSGELSSREIEDRLDAPSGASQPSLQPSR